MRSQVEGWAADRLDKLGKRLAHHRDLAEILGPASALKAINDRNVFEIEKKILELNVTACRISKRSRRAGHSDRGHPATQSKEEPAGQPAAPQVTRAAK